MGWHYTLQELAALTGAQLPAGLPAETTFSAVSTDTRRLERGQVFFALSGPNFDGNTFAPEAFEKGAVAVVTTRAVPGGPCLCVPDPLAALQRLAQHHRRRHKVPILAITGSCGKTTAKDMTAAVLGTRFRVVRTQGNLNNEIGCPLSLLQVDEDTGFAVIEMGANHVGEIALLSHIARPSEAAITMIGPAHLEGFGGIERVAQAKAEIIAGLPESGRFYVNVDDARCRAIGERFPGRKVHFGSSGEVVLRSAHYEADGELTLEIDPVGRLKLPLPVRAQATNVLLAVAVGLQHGVMDFETPLRAACADAARFRIRQVGPLEVLDDSYNANPASMAAAIEALAERPGSGRRFAALGEMLELGEGASQAHEELGVLAAARGISALYVRGEHAHAMIAGARDGGIPLAEILQDPTAMARAIFTQARAGDKLLVKGSRGARMERVIQALEELYQAENHGRES